MSYYAQAQLYGPIMERFSMGELEVGIMFTQELTVFALTALIVAGPLSRVSRIRAACTGCIIHLTANRCCFDRKFRHFERPAGSLRVSQAD